MEQPPVNPIDRLPRSSSANAAVAFAVATAGSSNPPDVPLAEAELFREAARRKCSITSSISTMRVLSVLRHWVTKHTQVRLRQPLQGRARKWSQIARKFEYTLQRSFQ